MLVTRHIMGLLTTLTLSLLSLSVYGKPLSQDELRVCKSIRQCVDIVSRHDSESYDYTVLSQEFMRFGDRGRSVLLKMMTSQNAKDSYRAQQILSQSYFQYTPEEQRLIAAFWPNSDPYILRPLILQLYSPLMRNTLIRTATHPDKTFRDLSLDNLKTGEATIGQYASFQPKPEHLSVLIKAVQENPSLELINFLATYPMDNVAPTLIQSLAHEKPAVVRAAYIALENADATSAEIILIDHIQNTTSAQNILALMSLLDANVSDTQKNTLRRSLKPKLPLVWNYLKRKPLEDVLGVLDTLTLFERSSDIDKIYLDALNYDKDWRVSARAAELIGQYKLVTAIPRLTEIANTHPVRDMRFAALTARDRLNNQTPKFRQYITKIDQALQNCQIVGDNIREVAKPMPFFQGLRFTNGRPVTRSRLTTATPTPQGWLAGYIDKTVSKIGVLGYYDNATGTPVNLLSFPVHFVGPKSVPALGKTTQEFWAFVSDPADPQSNGTVLSITEKTSGEFIIDLYAELPSKPISFKRHRDQSLSISFEETENSPFMSATHPPLRLSVDGAITSACTPLENTDSQRLR